MRINARLNGEWEKKLSFIAETQNLNQTEVIKKALDLLYEQVKTDRMASAALLEASGFIGGGEGAETLSETYKAELNDALREKYDNH